MDYTTFVTVEPSNTEENKVTETFTVSQGLIVQCIIYPVVDLGGTVRCRVLIEGQQLYPNVVGTYYTLTNRPVEIRDRYPLFPEENDVTLEAWARGSRYVHRIFMRMNVLPFTKHIRQVVIK